MDYPNYIIRLGNQSAGRELAYRELSPYTSVPNGNLTISISLPSAPGRILQSFTLPLSTSEPQTVAIVNTDLGLDVNTDLGLDIIQITDDWCCDRPCEWGCFRLVNLVTGSPPLTLSLESGAIIFDNLSFMQAMPLSTIVPAAYDFLITPAAASGTPAPQPLLTFHLDVEQDTTYTAYLLGRYADIQLLIVENG